MSLIKITQRPIIDFSKVEQVGKQVESELAKYNLENQVATKDNVGDLKKLRAKLNKEFREYEASRKAIKSAIDDPYRQFNEAYSEHIKSKYEHATTLLKDEIDRVEDMLRDEKTQMLQDYFDEVNTHEFLKFEQVGLNITLSASENKLKEQVDEFISKVDTDLLLISTQDNKERVLVRYYDTLDVSKAIISVTEELKREEQLQQVVQKEPKIEPKEDLSEVLQMTFTVKGTKHQLLGVKNYLDKEGLEYE